MNKLAIAAASGGLSLRRLRLIDVVNDACHIAPGADSPSTDGRSGQPAPTPSPSPTARRPLRPSPTLHADRQPVAHVKPGRHAGDRSVALAGLHQRLAARRPTARRSATQA